MQEEINFYNAHQAEFAQKYAGKYLIIRGRELLGFFDTQDEAYAHVSKTYPPGTVLIQLCAAPSGQQKTPQTAAPIAGPKKTPGCIWAVLAVIGLVVFLGIIGRMTEGEKSPAEIQKEKDESIFSSWDGSVPALKTYMKERLNDPESFEHVETKYIKKPDHYIVVMKYRGKNAFNATLTKSVTAKVSTAGAVMEIISE